MTQKIDHVLYHPNFKAAFRSLSPAIQEKALAKEALFREDVFHPLLRTHKLKGRLTGFYAFSVDAKYRILFQLFRKSAILLDVDDHDLYR